MTPTIKTIELLNGQLPADCGSVGYSGDENVTILRFTGADPALSYKLDMRSQTTGAIDVLDLTNDGGTLSVTLDGSIRLRGGRYRVQLRTIGNIVWHSNQAWLTVNSSVDPFDHYDDVPDEMRQLEQRATEAAAAAETAETAAETAQGKAEDAQTAAETAQGKAEDAQTAAETAQSKAEDAQAAAEAAQTAAETAQGKAEDAQTAAETAQGKAEDAQTAAETAQTAAETAQGKAEDAQTAAEAAQTAAETAQGKAEDAQTAAEAAAAAAANTLLYALPCKTIINTTTLGADNVPIKGLSIAVQGSQSGSGTPMPDNVRPFITFTSATLTAPDGDATQFAVVNDNMPHPQYDAAYDAATKTLTTRKVVRTLSTAKADWTAVNEGTYRTSVWTGYQNVTYNAPYNTYGAAEWMPIADYSDNRALGFRVNNGTLTVYGANNISGITDLDSFIAYITQHPINVMLTYKTAYIATINDNPSLESLDIRTQLGNNTFSADTGDVAATIRMDPTLAFAYLEGGGSV